MHNNKIITNAIILTRICQWIIYLFLTLFIIATAIWYVDPVIFKHVDVSNSFHPGFGFSNFNIITHESPGGDFYPMSQLSSFMMGWLFIRIAAFSILTILILRKAMLVLHSINGLNTFYQGNILHFRNMATYGFVLFVLSCFNMNHLNDTLSINLTLAFGPLLFSITSLVLAEIFKEGKNLLEDKNMII